MVPEDDGNQEKIEAKKFEVLMDDMLEVEQCLAMSQTFTEKALELTSKLKLLSLTSAASEENSEIVRALTAKQIDLKVKTALVLFKVRDMIREGLVEDATSLNQKRCRQPSPPPLDVARGLSTGVHRTSGELVLASEVADPGSVAPSKVSHGTSSPSSAGEKLFPLKYMKTSDNTKAPFQKPATIFSSAPRSKAGLLMDSNELLVSGMSSKIASVCKSPKRRPNRCKRDWMSSNGAGVPEPVIQRLLPGDTNKIPDDGYLWRKYGNKPIKTASYKRGYYKCRYSKEVRCMATKIVQQTNEDPTTFSVSYKGEHTCRQLGNLSADELLTNDEGGEDEGGNQPSLDQPKKSPAEEEEEEMNKDDDGDGMDWPSDSASEDNMFDSSEFGDETGDCALSTMDPDSILFIDKLPSIGNIDPGDIVKSGSHPAYSWDYPIRSMDSTDFNKISFSPIEPCALDGPDVSSLRDDENQLLKRIGEGLWEHPSDISYWYNEGDGQLN